MRTSALFGAKTSDFSEFMVYPQDKWEGVEPVRAFWRLGRLLWMAPFLFLPQNGDLILTHLFAKVSRPGVNEGTFSVFELSCHLLSVKPRKGRGIN